MPKQFATTAFDHDSTLVLALELSGKCWEVGAVPSPSMHVEFCHRVT